MLNTIAIRISVGNFGVFVLLDPVHLWVFQYHLHLHSELVLQIPLHCSPNHHILQFAIVFRLPHDQNIDLKILQWLHRIVEVEFVLQKQLLDHRPLVQSTDLMKFPFDWQIYYEHMSPLVQLLVSHLNRRSYLVSNGLDHWFSQGHLQPFQIPIFGPPHPILRLRVLMPFVMRLGW